MSKLCPIYINNDLLISEHLIDYCLKDAKQLAINGSPGPSDPAIVIRGAPLARPT